jgi:hypothetical protein
MSYDTSANSDKITGSFSSPLTYPFSIVAWTKKTAAQWADTTDDKLVHMQDEGASGLNHTHGIINKGVADNVSAASWNASAARVQADEPFTDGTYDSKWVCVIGIWAAADDRRIYIEEYANEGLGTSSTSANLPDNIAVGGAVSSSFQQWNGLVAEVAVFDKALTESEINALQTSEGAGPPPNSVASSNCIGYWSLDTDQGTHSDESGNGGPTLTVESSAPFSSDHPTISLPDPIVIPVPTGPEW